MGAEGKPASREGCFAAWVLVPFTSKFCISEKRETVRRKWQFLVAISLCNALLTGCGTATTKSEPVETQSQQNARDFQNPFLEAEIQRNIEEFRRYRSRKLFIGAHVSDPRIADYEKRVLKKIEAVGNQNYPDQARGRAYGSVQVTVNIKPDGSLESVEINRSSGYDVLDRYALQIVQLASPFEPFPPEVRQNIDVLGIIRTLSFEPKKIDGDLGR